jgi:hypothetical protein
VANVGTGIILVAGGMTFANEWYQTGKVNWRVPIATLLAAAVIDGVSKFDDKAGVGLSIMVLIVASITKFGGKSVVDTINEVFTKQKTQATAKPHLKVA